MERYKELKEMLHAELERIQGKGELNMQSLEQADKLAHTLKDIATVEAMESEKGYSEHYPVMGPYYRGGMYDDGDSFGSYGSYNSYARGRGSRASRDSLGRYASEMRRGSYDDGESMESYRGR